MPLTVHKILIHGSSVIKNSILPIGHFSEEVLEASHKICKKFRRDNTRKISRIATNKDLFSRLHLYSDPLITLSGNLPKKKLTKLPAEVIDLFVIENVYSYNTESESTSDSE